MITLVTRPYAGETDLQIIADFLNDCEVVDQLDRYYSVSELRLEFSQPSFNPDQDMRLWENSKGDLIGIGQTWIPESADPLDGYLWFQVHPQVRGKSLENEIMAWAESRMKEVGRLRQVTVQLRASARNTWRDRIIILEQHGFEIDRAFLTLKRLLTKVPEPTIPAGFTIRSSYGPSEAERWVEMFNQSFIDHWNYHPMRLDSHLHWLSDPQYRADLDLVAVAPDGTLAAFCYCAIDHDFNQHKGRQEGWVNLLGTRRGFRRLGLGRAILLTGLQRLQLAGMTIAKIGVDAQNPNGARQLYESIGFESLHTNLAFFKDRL